MHQIPAPVSPDCALCSESLLLRVPLVLAMIWLQQELVLCFQSSLTLQSCNELLFLGLSFPGCGRLACLTLIDVWLHQHSKKMRFINSGSVWLPSPHHCLTLFVHWNFTCNFFRGFSYAFVDPHSKHWTTSGFRSLQTSFQKSLSLQGIFQWCTCPETCQSFCS